MKTIQGRPKLRISPSPTDVAVELVAAAGLAFLLITSVNYWQHLPAKIPMHFNGSGAVDQWGPKTGLWVMPVIGVVSYLALTIIGWFPWTFNYPVRITAENAERQYRIGVAITRWLKMEILWILAYVNWQTIQIAMGRTHKLSAAFMPVTLAVITGTIIVLIVQAYRGR